MDYVEIGKLLFAAFLAAVLIKSIAYMAESLVAVAVVSMIVGPLVAVYSGFADFSKAKDEINLEEVKSKVSSVNPMEEIIVLTEEAPKAMSINSIPEKVKDISVKVIGKIDSSGAMGVIDSISEVDLTKQIVNKAATFTNSLDNPNPITVYDEFVASLNPVQKKILDKNTKISSKIREVLEEAAENM